MPATYQIDKEKSWIEITISGESTAEELAEFTRQMHADPDYSDDLCGIVDCREMTNVIELNELRSFADDVNRRPGPAWRSKRAVIVASTAHYSITRMFMLFAESSPIQYNVFYSRETAMEWLKE
jgi:hypothetical protein